MRWNGRLQRHHMVLLVSMLLSVLLIALTSIPTRIEETEGDRPSPDRAPSKEVISARARKYLGMSSHATNQKSAQGIHEDVTKAGNTTSQETLADASQANAVLLDSINTQQTHPGTKPYPTFRGKDSNVDWPDTPEIRALVAQFDENCDYLNDVTLPLLSEIEHQFDALMGVRPRRDAQGRITQEGRQLQVSREECLADIQAVKALRVALHKENMELIAQMSAKKREFLAGLGR